MVGDGVDASTMIVEIVGKSGVGIVRACRTPSPPVTAFATSVETVS